MKKHESGRRSHEHGHEGHKHHDEHIGGKGMPHLEHAVKHLEEMHEEPGVPSGHPVKGGKHWPEPA